MGCLLCSSFSSCDLREALANGRDRLESSIRGGQCQSSELLLYLDLYLEGLLWQRSRVNQLLRARPTCIPRSKLTLFSISKVVDCQLSIRHDTDTRTSNAVRTRIKSLVMTECPACCNQSLRAALSSVHDCQPRYQ